MKKFCHKIPLWENSRVTHKEILQKAVSLRNSGQLYPRNDQQLEDWFCGSIDRFALIAARLQGKTRVLDIGAGLGLLTSLLFHLGHECYAVDIVESDHPIRKEMKDKIVEFKFCNVEADPIPFPDNFFDAVTCCQVLEHFTFSHLPAVKEMHRVLKPGGVVEIDVPNVAAFRNRVRLLRGKHITWDYKQHYLETEPIVYKGKNFFPVRHNREFTLDDLQILLSCAGFKEIDVRFLKSRRQRTGLKKLKSLGTGLKDLVPSFRKSLIGFAVK